MIIKIGINDNVGIVSEKIESGSSDNQFNIVANETLDVGHKIALNDIFKDQPIIKYNQIIGLASEDIFSGDHVHLHNVMIYQNNPSTDSIFNYEKLLSSIDFCKTDRNFSGFLRNDGKVGTRNYVGVMSTVNCVSTVVRKIARSFEKIDEYANVDGVVPISHSQGCGHAIGKEGIEVLIKVLIGYIIHPNFHSLLIVGLGCEDNQMSTLLERVPKSYRHKIKFLVVADNGGTKTTVNKGKKIISTLLKQAVLQERSPQPVAHLNIALQCGGSDSFSGISSNPVLGYASDQLVELGGTSILAETPEIYGAEHLMFNRMNSKTVKKLKDKIDWWKEYLSSSDLTFNANPSPGNKNGGLTTINEKSLGSVSKSGYSKITDVIDYATPTSGSGLFIMDSPGYDPVSVTGQIASGATIICFTTGRGSAIGFKPSPCIKISSNSNVYNSMIGDIDFNCGPILNGSDSISNLGSQLFELIIETASGRQTSSEFENYGDNEFSPWQLGPVM
jgi:altronate dehydratase